MNTSLTLLFVCNASQESAPFLASLPGGSDRLLVGHRTEDTKMLLSAEPVDAIIIHQDRLQEGCSVVADLKRAAPRTPMMLLRSRKQCNQGVKPPGIVAVCCADLRDEKLIHAMWMFFRLILGKQALNVCNGT
jgi:hypothetical protein